MTVRAYPNAMIGGAGLQFAAAYSSPAPSAKRSQHSTFFFLAWLIIEKWVCVIYRDTAHIKTDHSLLKDLSRGPGYPQPLRRYFNRLRYSVRGYLHCVCFMQRTL